MHFSSNGKSRLDMMCHLLLFKCVAYFGHLRSNNLDVWSRTSLWCPAVSVFCFLPSSQWDAESNSDHRSTTNSSRTVCEAEVGQGTPGDLLAVCWTESGRVLVTAGRDAAVSVAAHHSLIRYLPPSPHPSLSPASLSHSWHHRLFIERRCGIISSRALPPQWWVGTPAIITTVCRCL